jgi:hypothetical protein
VLLGIDRRRVLRPGNLFALYVGGYFLGRLWVEALRIDPASVVLGLRVNIWISLVAMAGVLVVLAVRGVRRHPDDLDDAYVDGHTFTPADSATPEGSAAPADSATSADSAAAGEADPDGDGDDGPTTTG